MGLFRRNSDSSTDEALDNAANTYHSWRLDGYAGNAMKDAYQDAIDAGATPEQIVDAVKGHPHYPDHR